MEEPFAKAPLDLQKREIRLVKLEHSNQSEPIKCSLRTCTLEDECSAYVALSYAWEEEAGHNDIYLNGVLHPVSRNLWSFLNQMRSQHLYITFWIDALSINQANILEKNHQVQTMRHIYGNAHSVWVWLGEADEITSSDVAMQYLTSRQAFNDKEYDFGRLWSPRQARAVLALCQRNYWNRIWIVQEIMVAKKASILCGDKQVSWAKFQNFIADLQIISDRGLAMHTIGGSVTLDSPAAVIVKAKMRWNGNPQPLSTLLEIYRQQQATDIRDKVYALHGLAYDNDSVVINYNIEPKALLLEVLYHICSSQALRPDLKRDEKDVLRFAKMMSEVLKVNCTEDELQFHVCMARGEGVKKVPTMGA
jgi:hypothetical protein